MAKFCGKNLKLGSNDSVYFGDSDEVRLWYDNSDFRLDHTVSGTAATAGYHLIQKSQVDAAIAAVSGTVITDHGALTGLGDDDHTQYSLVDGTRAFTGVVGGVTPTANNHLTTKQYVDSAISGLDWQDSVLSKSYSGPPGGSVTGDRYIIGPTASGSWAGNENNIAEYNGSTWDITATNEGFASWVEDEDVLYVYNGSAWVKFGSTVTHGNLLALDQDDHPQYHNDTRGDARYYQKSEVDTISGTLQTNIDNHTGDLTIHRVINDSSTSSTDLWSAQKIDQELSTISGSIITDHGTLTGLGDDDHTQYVPTDAIRGFTATVSGIDPTLDYHLATKYYIDNELATISGGIVQDHGGLTGLGDDDHTQYTLADGTRDFSGIVSYNSHPSFSADENIVDKKYVDDEITTLSGSMVLDHGGLTGLGDDDHIQYILVDGTRGFTNTVSGVDPTLDYHLATKKYIDDEITNNVITDHGALTGLGDDDHTQYILVDGTRGFTATVSGVDPTQDYHLTTKSYVDSVSVDKVKSGRLQLATNDSSKAVTFGTAFADTNYTVSVILSNTVDATPCIYPVVISAKAATGFSVVFSGDIETNNYYLEWIAHHD